MLSHQQRLNRKTLGYKNVLTLVKGIVKVMNVLVCIVARGHIYTFHFIHKDAFMIFTSNSSGRE